MFGILLSCMCFASYKYSHHSIIIATSFGHTFSATTSFQFVSGRVCIMAITRAGAITAAAKAVAKSRRMRNGVSQQQENKNGVNANQRSDKVNRGLRVDAAAAAGGSGGRRRQRGVNSIDELC
jgi:hypothetical protein